jgi:hypothetical protein
LNHTTTGSEPDSRDPRKDEAPLAGRANVSDPNCHPKSTTVSLPVLPLARRKVQVGTSKAADRISRGSAAGQVRVIDLVAANEDLGATDAETPAALNMWSQTQNPSPPGTRPVLSCAELRPASPHNLRPPDGGVGGSSAGRSGRGFPKKLRGKPLAGPIRFYDAIFRACLAASPKVVLGALFSFADWNTGGGIRATAESIAERAGLSERTTRTQLRYLEDSKLVCITSGARGGRTRGGRGIVPVRAINLPEILRLKPANVAPYKPAEIAYVPGGDCRSSLMGMPDKPAPVADNQDPSKTSLTTTTKTAGHENQAVVVVGLGGKSERHLHEGGEP